VLETSFLPGRSFSGPADFNTQLAEWLERVNQRQLRALGCAPCDRIVAERQQMLTLPPVPPATGWRIWLRLPDHYVRLDGNDYSVHPSVIGRRIEVVADLDRVRAFCDGRLVPDHARVWARHPIPTMSLRPSGCGWTGSAGCVRHRSRRVEIRCLADYDRPRRRG
jgi:hypothetical protein